MAELKVVQLPPGPPPPVHECAPGLKRFYETELAVGRELPIKCVVACICGRRWKLLRSKGWVKALAPIIRPGDEWRDNPTSELLWDYAGHAIADWDDVKDVRSGDADV